MQWIIFAELIMHCFNQQAICVDHHLRVTAFHAEHNLVIILIPGNTQKFHCTFYHSNWCITITTHDPVAQRTMISPNAHGCSIFLADLYEGSKPFTNAVNFLSLIHISEPTRQAEISYAVFCLKKKK